MTKKRKIVIISLGVLLLGGGTLTAVLTGNSSKQMKGMPTEISTIQKETIRSTVSAKGEVSLLNKELIYASTASEVEEVLVEKNDMVTEGQIIIRYKEKTKEKLLKELKDAQLDVRRAELSLQDSNLPPDNSDIEKGKMNVSNAERSLKDTETEISKLDDKIERQKDKISDAKKDLEDTERDNKQKKALYEAGGIPLSDIENSEKTLRDRTQLLKDAEDILETYEKDRSISLDSIDTAKEKLEHEKFLYEEIFKKNTTASSKNEAARKQVDLEKSRIRVQGLQSDIDDFQREVRSPIEGTVMKVSVSQGELAPTDKILMEIANVNDYNVKVDVNERNGSKIKIDQDVVISGSVLGKQTVNGKISKISNIAEEKTTNTGTERVMPVEITINAGEDSSALKPGFSLEAVITTDIKENIAVVPILSTLGDSDGNNYVFIVKEDNTLEKRVVELGIYSDMTVEAIGVNEGEKIVSQPTAEMFEGMEINPLNMLEPSEETLEEGAGETK